MQSHQPSILVVYPYQALSWNVTICALLDGLASRGARVRVLLPAGQTESHTFHSSVRLTRVPSHFFDVHLPLWRRMREAFGGKLAKRLLNPQSQDVLLATDPSLMRRVAMRHDLIIAVDPVGLATASILAKGDKVPLAYVSFEILFDDELTTGSVEAAIRTMERAAAQGVVLTLVQDPERGAALTQELGILPETMVHVPVAPLPCEVPRGNLLRERLGIADHRKIVLFSGSLGGWSSLFELDDMVAGWPEDFVLVVHSHTPARAPAMVKYLKGLESTGRIRISWDPVPAAAVNALIASADIGLAPYRPLPLHWTTQDNLLHMGHASGKVATYAMCGLPILARALPVFERDFAAYRCGRVYRHDAETGALLHELANDLPNARAEARRYYSERLDPRPGLDAFCRRTLALAGAVQPT